MHVQGDKRHLNTAMGLGKVLPVSPWVLPTSALLGDGLLHEVSLLPPPAIPQSFVLKVEPGVLLLT